LAKMVRNLSPAPWGSPIHPPTPHSSARGIPIALAASPQVINGRWRKPLISRRRLAELRKEHLAQGLPWEEPAPKFKVAKPPPNPNKPRFKGHKRLRPENIEKRYA